MLQVCLVIIFGWQKITCKQSNTLNAHQLYYRSPNQTTIQIADVNNSTTCSQSSAAPWHVQIHQQNWLRVTLLVIRWSGNEEENVLQLQLENHCNFLFPLINKNKLYLILLYYLLLEDIRRFCLVKLL